MTGHTGFKGGWLSLWLQQLGAEVTGYSLPPPTEPNLFVSANIARNMTSIIGDIRDSVALTRAMIAAQPEIVIHMAAQPLVRYSYVNPVETYSTNVMGTVHLLEGMRALDTVRAAVIITSDKCYENREWVWGYRENEAMGGYDPYSSSKGCAELVISAYRSSYFNPADYTHHGVAVASARAGNVIGGGDWAMDRLIPDIIRAIVEKKPVVIRNPNAIRPWQHVLEPLAGYLLLAEKLFHNGTCYGDGWNFGPTDSDVQAVSWIVERMTTRWGEDASWVLNSTPQPHEATLLRLDCSKAHTILGWQPRWHLGQTLDLVVDWYKAAIQGDDMRSITQSQIQSYQQS